MTQKRRGRKTGAEEEISFSVFFKKKLRRILSVLKLDFGVNFSLSFYIKLFTTLFPLIPAPQYVFQQLFLFLSSSSSRTFAIILTKFRKELPEDIARLLAFPLFNAPSTLWPSRHKEKVSAKCFLTHQFPPDFLSQVAKNSLGGLALKSAV